MDGERVPLKEYFERLLHEHDKTHSQLAENVKTALASQDKRLDGMNEFRASLDDATKNSVTRDYYDSQHDALEKRVALGENFRSKIIGGAAVLVVLGGAVGGAIVQIFTK